MAHDPKPATPRPAKAAKNGINKLRSGARINAAEAKRMRKGLSKEQILRLRSGAQISEAEAKRFSAMTGKAMKAAGKAMGKAMGKAGRRKLPASLTSEKRGSLTKRGGLALGKGLGRKTGHKERGRIGLRSR